MILKDTHLLKEISKETIIKQQIYILRKEQIRILYKGTCLQKGILRS